MPPILHRRTMLFSLAGFAAAGSAARAELPPAWTSWKADFLADDGRVIDDGQQGISHSEGQAYGLLLAQAFGDREAFERIEDWTRRTLATRQDALMAWKWQGDAVTDWRNATDGDLLRAWALLRAERDSLWPGHGSAALRIAADIARICLRGDPRAPDEPLLAASDMAATEEGSLLVNPSYYMRRALIELGQAADLPVLIRAAVHGDRLLEDPAAQRDWIAVSPDGIGPAAGHDDRFGWDALRIPLYLVWSGRAGHPAVAAAAARFGAARTPGHVATVTAPDGTVLAESDAAGFRAVAALARGEYPPDALPGQGYYPATLSLLAWLAVTESGGELQTR